MDAQLYQLLKQVEQRLAAIERMLEVLSAQPVKKTATSDFDYRPMMEFRHPDMPEDSEWRYCGNNILGHFEWYCPCGEWSVESQNGKFVTCAFGWHELPVRAHHKALIGKPLTPDGGSGEDGS